LLVKTRTEEYSYIGLQLLNRRLPERHELKELIHSKMHMALAGIHGEVRVNRVFNNYSFPFEYVVLHDVCLESYGNFQIDTVFLTPYFAVILESKNIGGKLSFKQNPKQLERENEEGKVDVFESPEVQIERNIYLLGEWLKQHSVTIPVFGVIVLTNSKVRVIEPPTEYKVILHQTIPIYLKNIPRKKQYISIRDMHKLSKEITTSHKPYFPYPMCNRWRIHPNDLYTGVCCEKCETFGMDKRKNGWNCMRCGHVDKFAHEKAIHEWFVLIGETINNRQCRKFLHIDSHHIASRLLKSMNLVRTGTSQSNIEYKWKW